MKLMQRLRQLEAQSPEAEAIDEQLREKVDLLFDVYGGHQGLIDLDRRIRSGQGLTDRDMELLEKVPDFPVDKALEFAGIVARLYAEHMGDDD